MVTYLPVSLTAKCMWESNQKFPNLTLDFMSQFELEIKHSDW